MHRDLQAIVSLLFASLHVQLNRHPRSRQTIPQVMSEPGSYLMKQTLAFALMNGLPHLS